MLIPVKAVHRAALVLREQGDITETMFENTYHCKIGKLSPDLVNYYDIYFDTEHDATAFLLRWS